MNNLYLGARLYFVNRKISRLEDKRKGILDQNRLDLTMQSMMAIDKFSTKISDKLKPLYGKREKLETELSTAQPGFFGRLILRDLQNDLAQSAEKNYGRKLESDYANNSQYDGGVQ